MPNEHIDANTPKAISLATGLGISQDRGAPRAVASSRQNAIGPLDSLSPPTLYVLS